MSHKSFYTEQWDAADKVRFKPLADSQTIHQDAEAIIKIQYLDASTMDQEQLKTVYEYKMQRVEDVKLPLLESIGEFKAEVPCQLKGWSDATIIDVEIKLPLREYITIIIKFIHFLKIRMLMHFALL